MIKTGFSKVAITNSLEYKKCGYTINDPLMARCMVILKDNKPSLILFMLDFVEFPEPFVTAFRNKMAKTLHVNPSIIILHATHTHSVPGISYLKHAYFVKILIATAKKAIGKACESEVSYTKTEAGKGFNINRRWDSKKYFGTISIITNQDCVVKNDNVYVKGYVEKELKGLGFPKIKVSPSAKLESPVDSDLTLLLFRDLKGKVTGGIVRYASHPTFIAHFHGNTISCDYPGALLRALEKYFGGDFIFLNGCSGDLRPYSKDYSVKGAMVFGQKLATKLINASKHSGFSLLDKAVYSAKKIQLKTRTDYERDVNKLTANFWLLRETNTPENLAKMPVLKARAKDELRWVNDTMIYSTFVNFNGDKQYINRKNWPYNLGFLSIGPANYAFFQEEVLSEMSVTLKKRFPELKINTVSLANGGSSYLVPLKEIKKCGYEYTCSILGKDAFAKVQNTAIKFISGHKEKK